MVVTVVVAVPVVVALVGPGAGVTVVVVAVVVATHDLQVPGHLSCRKGRLQYFGSRYVAAHDGPSQTPLQNCWQGFQSALVKVAP